MVIEEEKTGCLVALLSAFILKHFMGFLREKCEFSIKGYEV